MKYHKPLTPTTPLPYTNNWIMYSDFTTDEIENIKLAKHQLIERLQTFWMTTKKVNRDKSWFVSGGCIGSLLRGDTVNDIDVYFFSGVDALPVIKLFTEDESYKNEVADINDKYRDVVDAPSGKLITENAITLKNDIQIITKHYGLPEEVRKTFDFIHCTPYFDSRDQKLYISKKQYDLNMNKTLKCNNASAITSSREQKFFNKGWKYGT